MSESANKVRLSFSFPDTMKEKLMKLAEKDNRKLATYVKKVLNSHVKKLIIAKRS